jgi:hypothetical protein
MKTIQNAGIIIFKIIYVFLSFEIHNLSLNLMSMKDTYLFYLGMFLMLLNAFFVFFTVYSIVRDFPVMINKDK